MVLADSTEYRQCVGEVAKERRYLATVEGFTPEQAKIFVQRIVAEHLAVRVASFNGRIIGWCDIIPKAQPGYTHAASLGMGVLQPWRNQGLGRGLLEATLAAARQQTIERIELIVYSDNARAIGLYESAGFLHEGRKQNARRIDGTYQDELLMALMLMPGDKS